MTEPKKKVNKYYFDTVEISAQKYNKFIDNALATNKFESLPHLNIESIEINETLSETTKTFVKEWAKQQIYGYKKDITSKEINKGIIFEDTAIDKAIEWLDLPFAIKNEQRFTDEYFTGEPDLILPDEIIDIKNSWSWETFPLFESNIPNDDYFAQVQVYMHLTGKRKARVVYILLETPETYNQPAMSYDHVEKKYRVKEFAFDYEPEIIEKLKERIINIRNYINELSSKI